jgi:hypothetical protein
MSYLLLLLVGLAVVIFILNVKNFNTFLHRFIYFVVSLILIITIILLIQPKDYIVFNSNQDIQTTKSTDNVSKIQFLALKMKTEGFSEEQIVESFYHEYQAKPEVASDLEKAKFSLKTIQKFFTNYKSSGILENRKLTKAEYLRYLVEQDVKRFAKFSNEDKAKIRQMEKKKVSIVKIKEMFPTYEPNDEVKAIELGNTGKSLREIKKVFPNYEPKK